MGTHARSRPTQNTSTEAISDATAKASQQRSVELEGQLEPQQLSQTSQGHSSEDSSVQLVD